MTSENEIVAHAFDANISEDDMLGGALSLYQPKDGYRIGMDTVLLAAAVPAKSGQHILEPGVGTGGAALCLLHRVSGSCVTGIDTNSMHLALAAKSAEKNRLGKRLFLEDGTVCDVSGNGSGFDHTMINPPFLAEGRGKKPTGVSKEAAHVAHDSQLRDWLRYAIHHTKAKGSITLIHRADSLDQIIKYLAGPCGDLIVFPLWPRQGEPAKRVIIQATKGTKGVARLLPGLVLHETNRRYTKAASAVLRDGAALTLNSFAL